jgi:hypothetical protein
MARGGRFGCTTDVSLFQGHVGPLDLSGVDLSLPSGEKLTQDHSWTVQLVCKLSAPLLIAMVRLVNCQICIVVPCGL